ncbi:MAG: DUF3332 family protein [Chitinispirillaceae bacterium]|nr:DUF3332 family protein [Chitinispirillaceae bacterium]
MLRKALIMLVCSLFTLTSTGCYGSFSLTKKIYKWNGSVGEKFAQSGIMWLFVILPVYQFCGFIDFVVLNLIEFWTGSNPLALNSDTTTRQTFNNGDKSYEVEIGKGALCITETAGPDVGKSVTVSFDAKTASWHLSDGTTSKVIASINPKPLNTIDLYYPDGKTTSKPLDDIQVSSRF